MLKIEESKLYCSVQDLSVSFISRSVNLMTLTKEEAEDQAEDSLQHSDISTYVNLMLLKTEESKLRPEANSNHLMYKVYMTGESDLQEA